MPPYPLEIFTGKSVAVTTEKTEITCRYYKPMTERTSWGPLRNLYASEATQRFLFWSSVPGRGWSIGDDKTSQGSHENSKKGSKAIPLSLDKVHRYLIVGS